MTPAQWLSSEVTSHPGSTGTSNDGNAEAGPSTPSRPSRKRGGPTISGARASVTGTPESNGQVPNRRVLPARIRRAAGGGQEGIRDLEEMIVDWLERWGTFILPYVLVYAKW